MPSDLFEIPLKTITGADSSLADFRGSVLLVVNVASQCGLTPQYEALQQLYARYRERGLVVLGFPTNDFGRQEPGSEEEIGRFCRTNYAVDFPMFAKIVVTGEDSHPLYRALIAAQPKAHANPAEDFAERLRSRGRTPNPEPEILWNFEKFLIGRDGRVRDRFAPNVTPLDPVIVGAIEKALAV